MKIDEIIVDYSKIEFESLVSTLNSTVLELYSKLEVDSDKFKLSISDILNPEDIIDIIEYAELLQLKINEQFHQNSHTMEIMTYIVNYLKYS
jgi:hypothetical protein